MLKKYTGLLLALLFCLTLCPTGTARAEGEEDAFDIDSLHCRYAILVDASDPKTALYGIEKNADTQCATGSTIKILSCIIAIENGNLDDYVNISAEAVNFSNKNSLMGIKEGELWTLRDLLYGLMLPSGNDAAVAIAEYIAGSTNEFAKLMNKKAEELGMTSSHFITVNGRDSKSHYSTARDMAVLTAYALENETFCKIVGTAEYTCTDSSGSHTINLINTDRLIADQVASDGSYTPQSCLYKYAIGVKTGDTNNAGKCFIGAARNGGTTLIAVLLGGTLDDENYQKNWYSMRDKEKDPYNAQRFEDAIACFDYAFKKMSVLLTVQDLVDAGLPVTFNNIQVTNADPDDPENGVISAHIDLDTTVELQLMRPFYEELMPRISTAYTLRLSNPLYAPVTAGDTIGTLTFDFSIDGISPTYNLIADRSVDESIVATEPETVTAEGGTTQSLIGVATDKNGVEVNPEKMDGRTTGQTVLLIAVIVIAVAVIALLVFLIVVKIRREKRRKARLARKKRQREMMRRQRQREEQE